MIEYCNPDRKPFKIGQLVKETKREHLGFSVVLDLIWESERASWSVVLYHQHEGKTFTEHSYYFEPAEPSDD